MSNIYKRHAIELIREWSEGHGGYRIAAIEAIGDRSMDLAVWEEVFRLAEPAAKLDPMWSEETPS